MLKYSKTKSEIILLSNKQHVKKNRNLYMMLWSRYITYMSYIIRKCSEKSNPGNCFLLLVLLINKNNYSHERLVIVYILNKLMEWQIYLANMIQQIIFINNIMFRKGERTWKWVVRWRSYWASEWVSRSVDHSVSERVSEICNESMNQLARYSFSLSVSQLWNKWADDR